MRLICDSGEVGLGTAASPSRYSFGFMHQSENTQVGLLRPSARPCIVAVRFRGCSMVRPMRCSVWAEYTFGLP